MTDIKFDMETLPSGSRFLYRSLSAGPIREDVVLEWSGSGEFVKLDRSGWLSSRDRSMLVLLEVLGD
jgi:hypothetical protein